MDKIPIVYILDNFYRGGGTENQLAALIDNIDRERFIPYVLNLRTQWPGKSIDVDCEVVYLNTDSVFSLQGVQAIREVARFLKEKKARILQIYFYESRIVGALAGKLAGIEKMVFCRRDFGWWHNSRMLFVMRQLARLAHYFIVNAEAVRKLVARTEKFPAENIEVIYNGVELAPLAGATELKRNDFDIPDGAPIIGLVANYRPVKRIDRLVSAASRMENRQAHFIVVGTGPLEDDLKQQAAELGVGERFHFYHAPHGVYYLLKLFDIGVLTSDSEGLSNVLIEYALAGKPAVAFDVGGNGEIIADDQSGFVLPNGDVDLLAKKLDQLIDDKELAESLGRTAAAVARERYEVKNMVKKTEDFYLKILGV
jgi:glycosyltransferase involved in cell wall biosynthesis